MKVAQQTEAVQSIAESTEVASEQIDKGYEELKKAASRCVCVCVCVCVFGCVRVCVCMCVLVFMRVHVRMRT